MVTTVNWKDLPSRILPALGTLVSWIKKISWSWLFIFLTGFIFIFALKFPVEIFLVRQISEAVKASGYIFSQEELHFRFPLSISAKSISLLSSEGPSVTLYDVDFSAALLPLLSDRLTASLVSSGVQISWNDIQIRSSLEADVDLLGFRGPLVDSQGSITIAIQSLDFSPLKKLLIENEKTQMAAGILGDKIPERLTFPKIVLEAAIKDKSIEILKGEITGNEISAVIKGKIQMRDPVASSRLESSLNILATSPIWGKMADEVNMLKSMNVIGPSGDIDIPVTGSLNAPSFKLPMPGIPQ